MRPRTDAGPHRLWYPPPRLILYVLYIFGPVILFFFVPPLFYRVPMRVWLAFDHPVDIAVRYVLEALAVSAVWFAVAIGIVLWRVRRPAAGAREWTSRALWTGFLGCSTLGSAIALVHDFLRMPTGLEEIVHQIAFAPVLGVVLGAFVLRDLPRRTVVVRRVVVWALLLADLGVALGVPILLAKVTPAAVGAVAIFYGISVMGVSRRRALVAGLALILVILVALPLKEFLRSSRYGHQSYERTPVAVDEPTPAPLSEPPRDVDRLKQFDPWVLGFRFHRWEGPLLVVEFGMTRVLNRINRLGDLAYVIELTPASVPYAYGVTYAPLVGKVIPRLIWRESPREVAGQWYGHRYRFIDPLDTTSSDNVPMVTEGWVNDGWVGVLLSAAFVGFALRMIWTYWIGDSQAPGNVFLGMAVVGTAVGMESNLSLVMGGVLHALLIYWAVEVLIRQWGGASLGSWCRGLSRVEDRVGGPG